MDCLRCSEDDCIEDKPVIENLDVYMQFELDRSLKSPLVFFNFAESVVLDSVIVPDVGLCDVLDEKLLEWCRQHCIEPRVKSDVMILAKAMNEGFTGKKLEKALYKVRHREKYLASKRRCNLRRSKKLSG